MDQTPFSSADPGGLDDWFVTRLIPLQSRLFAFVATLVPFQADAEDLFQKTLLTAWQERARLDPGRDPFPWLCTVARNHVRNHHRARRAELLAPDVLDQLVDQLVAEQDYFDRRHAALATCLDRLPPRQRELIRSFYLAGETVKQFADRSGRGLQAAYKAIQRIHDALRECVTARLRLEASL